MPLPVLRLVNVFWDSITGFLPSWESSRDSFCNSIVDSSRIISGISLSRIPRGILSRISLDYPESLLPGFFPGFLNGLLLDSNRNPTKYSSMDPFWISFTDPFQDSYWNSSCDFFLVNWEIPPGISLLIPPGIYLISSRIQPGFFQGFL